jgi:hypothetical protein
LDRVAIGPRSSGLSAAAESCLERLRKPPAGVLAGALLRGLANTNGLPTFRRQLLPRAILVHWAHNGVASHAKRTAPFGAGDCRGFGGFCR